MQEKDYNSYFFLKNKNYRITIPLTTLICLLFLLIIEQNGRRASLELIPSLSVIHGLRVYFQIIPVMLLTSISGYAVGSLVVFLFFCIETLINHAFPYNSFILLLATLFANLPLIFQWYKKLSKTFLTAVIFSLVLGNIWHLILSILEDRTVILKDAVFFFGTALVPSTLVCILCYIYFNYFPEKIKNLFFTSVYDFEELHLLKSLSSKSRGHRIRERLTNLIIIEAAVLLVTAFFFANTLLDQFRNVTSWQQVVFATRLIILMSIVAAPLILFTFAYTNISITHPLQLMTKAIEDSNLCNITEHTRNQPRLDIKNLNIKSKDEIGILYNTLVDMLLTTESYIKNLERSQLLETQLASAKAASKAKSEFLSNMSHEIRTPINAVLGLNEMIIRESKDNTILNYAKDIENAGKNLLSIVNDILDFSKIEAGKLEIMPVNYDLSSSINNLVNMVSTRASNKGLTFNVSISQDCPHMLYGDDVRLCQCCLNLLTNAIKYTKQGAVTFSLTSKKVDYSHVLLTIHVIDTGIGIKDKDIPKLFTAFQRIEEERNRTIEGTGLGLNIVQSLLTLMNSRLEVVSVYGEGSDFYFSVLQGVIDWDPIGDFKETYQKSIENSSKYHELFKAPSARILVVDDTELNLTVVKGLLKQTEIQIDTVLSGYEALDALKESHYDLIFLDHRMPGMDGIQTFENMLKLEGNKSKGVPVIALTANAVSGAKEMYLTKGFSDYMTKPIEGPRLEEMILKYLPEELVEHLAVPENEGEIMALDENGEIEDTTNQEQMKKIESVTGINLEDALKYTGDPEILEETLKEFYKAIDKNAARIEEFVLEGDWRNYTIVVHALKSTARLIGAEKLSEDAKYLEKCGDDENEKEITEKTPGLLELYRSYKNHLAPLCAVEEDDSDKEEMSLEQYGEAVSNIGECVSAYDYDTADQIIAMMKDYKIPQEKKEHFAELEDAVRSVDHDKIMKIVNN